jgi:hypothetical protein
MAVPQYIIDQIADLTNQLNAITTGSQKVIDFDEMVTVDDQAVVHVQKTDETNEKLKIETLLNTISPGFVHFFDATIGATGADYGTLKEAIDAGKKTLLAIDNTLEVADITLPSSTLIYINTGVEVSLSGFNILAGANDIEFKKLGGGTLSYASSTLNKTMFSVNGNTGITFNFSSGSINNSSTQSGCKITDAQNQRINGCTINLPNTHDCGIDFNTINCFLEDVNIVGGGVLCYGAIIMTNGTVKDISITGDYSSTEDIITKPQDIFTVIQNVNIDTSTATPNLLLSVGKNNNIQSFTQSINIKMEDNSGSYSDILFNGGNLDFDGASNISVINCNFMGVLGTTNADNLYFIGCIFSANQIHDYVFTTVSGCQIISVGDITFSGSDNILTDLFLENGNIIVTGDNVTLKGCRANNIIIGYTKVDPTLPPPTEIVGDRYYLGNITEFPGAVHGDWDGAPRETTPEFGGATWAGDFTPNNTIAVGNRTSTGEITDNSTTTQETSTSLK